MGTKPINNFQPLGDQRPLNKGWAPGDYFNNCKDCGIQFVGEKRAYMCSDCAYGTKPPTDKGE